MWFFKIRDRNGDLGYEFEWIIIYTIYDERIWDGVNSILKLCNTHCVCVLNKKMYFKSSIGFCVMNNICIVNWQSCISIFCWFPCFCFVIVFDCRHFNWPGDCLCIDACGPSSHIRHSPTRCVFLQLLLSFSFYLTEMEFDTEWGLCAFAFLEILDHVMWSLFLSSFSVCISSRWIDFLQHFWFCSCLFGIFFLSFPKSCSPTLSSLWLVEITYQCLYVFQPITGIMFTWLWAGNRILFHHGILGWSHP